MTRDPDAFPAELGAAAAAWRKRNRYTKKLLSQLTGFSVSSIDEFEAGQRHGGNPVDARALQRYRLCCAAVGAGLESTFWFE